MDCRSPPTARSTGSTSRRAGAGDLGVIVAAVVLLLTFGAVVAAGLPLLLAAFGVAIAFMLGGILAAVIDTPDWASEVSIMIGLGVGIDYALLILTRYRDRRPGGPHASRGERRGDDDRRALGDRRRASAS